MLPFTPGQVPLASDFNQLTVAADLTNVSSPLKGSGLLRYLMSLAYAPGTVGAKLREHVSVKDADFGAIGDGVADDTVAIQAALTYASTVAGGCSVFVPYGTYKVTGSLNIFKRTVLVGDGRQASVLAFTNAGDGIKSTWPINSSTAVWISVRDLGITNSNGANTGGGFADVGGTFVDLINVYITGFRYQGIFDQSEIVTIERCEFIHPSGKTGLWLVNGADHTASAQVGFTNRITISACQFNGAGGGLENILDDGGVNHTIRDNNFNDGTLALRAAGVTGISFAGNESELHKGTAAMVWTNTTKAGAYVGACSAVKFDGSNTFYETNAGTFPVLIDEIQGGTINGNSFATAGAQIFLLTNNQLNPTSGLVIENNQKIVSGAARTACLWLNSGNLVPIRNVQNRQTPMTFVAVALGATGSQTVTPATMEGLHVGSRIVCQNQDGSNVETVIVTGTTSTTLTAPFASTKAANWCMYGTTPPNEEEGIWAPTLAGTTTPGAHTAAASTGKWSRRGNMVRLTGQIVITAKDAAMAGNLQIAGLPFVSNNVGSQIGTCVVTAFSGFTFPASYVGMGGSVGVAAQVAVLTRSGSAVASTPCVAGDIPGATCSLSFVIDLETASV